MSRDTKEFDFEPWDGTPGEGWEKFEARLFDNTTRSDDRGWSLADHLKGEDEGQPPPFGTGPAFPANPAENRKAQSAFRKRQKESYGIVLRHITATDIKETLQRDHFQLGRDAFNTAQASGLVPIDRLKLKQLNGEWDDTSILYDIGVNEHTISLLAAHIRAKNAKRPVANQHDETECTEKFLECLFTTSKHFSEGALIEYQAAAGARQFEHPAPAAAAIAAALAAGLPAPTQQRNFRACEQHYAPLWANAVKTKAAGFHPRAPVARPATSVRQTLESANLAEGGQKGREAPNPTLDLANAGSEGTYLPRPDSPSNSLAYFAAAGDELAARL